MTEPKAHYRLTSIEGVRPKGTQRPSPEDLEVLRQQLEAAGVPRPKGNSPAMTEYTPTTDDLFSWLSSITTEEDVRSVRRWLAEHDRQVAELAWDECRREVRSWALGRGLYLPPLSNPYRKDNTND